MLAATAGAAAAASLLDGAPARAQSDTDGGTGPDSVDLSWLEGQPPESPGSTWGVPWARGAFGEDQTFKLTAADGTDVPVQSWPWPTGPTGR
ncbi:hypothetical protein GCM10029992_17140 [Glycomyces albus]